MKRATLSLPLVVLLVVAFILSGCASPAPAPTTAPAPAPTAAAPAPAPTAAAPAPAPTAAAPAPAPTTAAPAAGGPSEILIGADIGLTGPMAGFGEGNKFGIQMAVDDINKLGGVMVKDLGKKLPLKVIFRDNESDPNKAATLAEQMIVGDKINFMVRGLEPPHISAPVATVTEKYKMVHISGVGPYEAWIELRKAAKPVWDHTWTPSFAIATPAKPGDYRHGKPGYTMMEAWSPVLDQIKGQINTKIAALASDEPDGRGWYLSFAPYMKDKGYEVYKVDKEFGLVPLETTDFSPLIKEWIAAGCDTLWINSPAPFFGTFWRQANTLGFKPKIVFASRAGLFYSDIKAWGGDLPHGVCNEKFWDPNIEGSVGIGSTTPKSFYEAWNKATGQPVHPISGEGYATVQVLIDAIERAGSIDGEKVNAALATTNLPTLYDRIQFDDEHFSRYPCFFGQWQKSDKPWVWDNPIVISQLPSVPVTGKLIFPIPYK